MAKPKTTELEDIRSRIAGLEAKADAPADLRAELRQILDVVTRTNERIERMEATIGNLQFAKGPPAPLGIREFLDAVRRDPMAKFEVLADYRHGGHTLTKGREIQANLFPQLAAHVRNGLKLTPATAIPREHRPAAAVV